MSDHKLVRLLPWLSVFALTLADPNPTRNQYCSEACETALSGQNFAGSPSVADGYYAELCGNMLHLQSLYLCARNYCSEADVEAGFSYLSGVCVRYATAPPPLSIVGNISIEEIRAQPILNNGDLPDIINTTVLPSDELFNLAYQTVVSVDVSEEIPKLS
jgi:hypothetical protein